jgi:hypothetical protein
LVQKHVYQDQHIYRNGYPEHTHGAESFATLCLRLDSMITTTSKSPESWKKESKFQASSKFVTLLCFDPLELFVSLSKSNGRTPTTPYCNYRGSKSFFVVNWLVKISCKILQMYRKNDITKVVKLGHMLFAKKY